MNELPFQPKPKSQQQSEEQARQETFTNEQRRKAEKHNWKIAWFTVVVGAIAGGVMGLITSVIFWLLTK